MEYYISTTVKCLIDLGVRMGTFYFQMSRIYIPFQELNMNVKLVKSPNILEMLLPEA